VFHFDAEWNHGGEKLRRAMQAGLPDTIQISTATQVTPDFHARFSAKGKIYRYEIFLGEADPFSTRYCWSMERELDLAAMEKAAAVLRGKHDFKAFAAEGGTERETTVRDLRRLEIRKRGRRMRLVFEADGFLYKMVRSLTGTLVSTAVGRIPAREVAAILKSAQRSPDVVTAPPHGLFLVKVLY
jgi:tRNA pseudouridine38-40 synthase